MRFNQTTRHQTKVLNHEGAVATQLHPKMELYAAVVTSLLNDSFYEKGTIRLERLKELVALNDPVFVAQLAVYAREKMYLRTTPLVLSVELAKAHNGDDLVRKLVSRVVQRADEIKELLAHYAIANQRNGVKKLNRLSKQVQKGLAASFNRFDGHQFAKYNRKTDVTLKDALFLVHPKAKSDQQQLLFDKIIRDELETPYTWETELSRVGQMDFETEKQKKVAVSATWEALVLSRRLGYLALLRNLRNILQTEPSTSVLKEVCRQINDPKAIEKSKVFPFQYLAAYRELDEPDQVVTEPRRSILGWVLGEVSARPKQQESVSIIREALEQAVLTSTENLAGFDVETRICVACDVSGSMFQPVSRNSKVTLFDVGLMLGMLLKSRCKTVLTGIFGDTWKMVSLPNKDVLESVSYLKQREGEVGYATNGHRVLQDLYRQRRILDKVMIFTDCQMWNSVEHASDAFTRAWKQYKEVASDAKLYLFDLAGYGQLPLSQATEDVFLIAGWSEKIFEVLERLDNPEKTLSMIEEIEL
ncbi:MAG: TROVE domain-containing protein [Bacteroidetes Order II. Incertae sedis bacterium]|nr:TROVE domain-containing protein [Bacteroidetes Order II. bacterium]